MALSGIEIFKLLPKTNCQECGVPTCMAFAVKLAAGQAELDSCPYVSDEAREKLEEASAPPIRPVVVGSGDNALKVGGETVIFRHEKTFVNKPGLGLLITDAMDAGEAESKLKKFKALEYERVGLILKADIVAIKDTSGDAVKFAKLVEKSGNSVPFWSNASASFNYSRQEALEMKYPSLLRYHLLKSLENFLFSLLKSQVFNLNSYSLRYCFSKIGLSQR